MPAFAATSLLWPALGASASAGAAVYGAHKQGQATDQATQIQEKANAEAIALQRQALAQEQAQWNAQQEFARQQWNQQESLRAPYRAAGQSALTKLSDLLGVSFQGAGGAAPTGSAASAPSGPGPSIIAQYQATHPASTDLSGVLGALKAGGVDASPYMYGSTPSGNEISLNGQKYKVISGEHTGNPSWYVAGTDDSGGAPSAPAAGRSLAAMGINPLYSVTQTPYAQAVPFRALLGR